MKESNKKQVFVSSLVNKDFGWKFGMKRNFEFNYHNCKNEKHSLIMEPNDVITISACEGNTISWEGTLKWDGRRLTPV